MATPLEALNAAALAAWLAALCLMGINALGGEKRVRIRVLDGLAAGVLLVYLLARAILLVLHYRL